MAAPFMDTLTAFDIIVLLLVALAALAGLARGFVGELASLLAWVAGVFAVRLFYTPAKVLAAGFVSSDAAAAVLAFAVLFLVAFITVRLIGNGLSRTTKASLIGPIDRLLGLGFGAAKGVLAAVLLFLLANLVFETVDPGQPSPEWLARARTAPTLAMVAHTMVDFVEERRRVAPDIAAVPDAAAATVDAAPDDAAPREGYDGRQRRALDALLDAQQKRAPGTTI
jgi:membrane protein required for colicin V production